MPQLPGRLRSLLLDPVLLGMGGLALATLAWFLVGPGGPISSWLLQTSLDLSIVCFSWRLVRLRSMPVSSRRFWRAMVAAGFCCAAGDLYQTVQVIRDPSDTKVALAQTVLVVTGMTIMVVTMLFHPLGAGTGGRQRLRLWLDATTVLTAVAVFLWYFSIGAQLDSARTADRYAAAASSAVMLVIAFGVVKLMLGGTAPFTLAAGITGGVGVAGTALGTSVGIILTGGSDPQVMFVAQLLPCILTAASLRLQELQLRQRRGERAEGPRRRSSRLPYLAVIGTQILLVVALRGAGPDARVWGVTAGVVIITALVLGRQLAAFHDNDRLITSLDQSMLELHSQKDWFRSLAQHASDVTVVIDAGNTVRYVSPAVARVLGIEPEAVTGGVLNDRIHPDDLPVFAALRGRLTAAPDGGASAQVRFRHTDGSYRWLDVFGTDLLDNPSVRGIVYNARDVTEARTLQDELRHQATHDTLTGLANRALLGQRLRELAGADVSVLVIDLDGFKQVNDIHGHHAGDHLLVTVAERLRRLMGPGELAARLGGDEFAVLLPGTPVAPAHEMATRITEAFAAPVPMAGERLRVRASIGVATGAAGDPDRLLRAADTAMYDAKHHRKAQAAA